MVKDWIRTLDHRRLCLMHHCPCKHLSVASLSTSMLQVVSTNTSNLDHICFLDLLRKLVFLQHPVRQLRSIECCPNLNSFCLFLLNNGTIPVSFLFSSFSHFNFNNTNWKKLRWRAWDSNLRLQDARRRQNHRAMAADHCLFCYRPPPIRRSHP